MSEKRTHNRHLLLQSRGNPHKVLEDSPSILLHRWTKMQELFAEGKSTVVDMAFF